GGDVPGGNRVGRGSVGWGGGGGRARAGGADRAVPDPRRRGLPRRSAGDARRRGHASARPAARLRLLLRLRRPRARALRRSRSRRDAHPRATRRLPADRLLRKRRVRANRPPELLPQLHWRPRRVPRGLRRVRGVEQIPWLYDGLWAVMERPGLAPFRRWLAAGARGRTLDVGCGTGRGLRFYGPDAPVVGIDPARASLARAARRIPGARLVQGSAEALPFRDGVFDTVVSSLVFCSVPDPARGFAEVRRVLRPDGQRRLLAHVRSQRRWKAAFQDRVQPL